MNANDIRTDIRSLISDCMGVDCIPDDPNLDLIQTLDIDSLDALEIAMKVQEHFEVVISEDEFLRFKTVSQMAGEVERALNKAGRPAVAATL
jgi:acyl carrier protein